MKRKALIIGSSPNNDYLPGVEKDVESWYKFLLSPCGGLWSASEITILREPSKSETVERSIWMADADFAKLVFIGHGFIENDDLGIPVTFLCLNDVDAISEREINPRTCWYIQILDCCRKFEDSKEPKPIDFSKAAVFRDADRARSLYDNAILRSEKGWVKMYAADIGQGAADENSFSQKLIAEASLWSDSSTGILDSKGAYDLLLRRFELEHPQQTPIHQAGRRRHYFPIAVGAQS